MRTIERYILIEYLRTFALALTFFIALVIIVRLLDKDIKRFDEDVSYLTAVQIVLLRTPRRIIEIVPLASFLAAFFVFGRAVQNNELSAMQTAGVSIYRLLIPILASIFLVCIGFVFFYNLVASPAFHRARQLEKKVQLRRSRNVVFKGQHNRLFYIQNLDLENETIDRMTIYELDQNDVLTREIFANSATWSPKEWHLSQGYVRRFDGASEIAYEPFMTKQIERAEEPERFAGSDKHLSAMTIGELQQQIKYKRAAGQTTRREEVKMHHKIAYPFAAFVVILIGAPISVRFGRAGFFAGLLVAFFLVFMYWGISSATLEGLGENGKLPPIVACWGGNVLYAIVGSVLIWKMPK